MTRASKLTAILLAAIAAAALSVGAFSIAHADGEGFDLGGGFDPYVGGFDPYAGGFDPYLGGFEPYAGGFDPYAGGFDPYSNGFDPYDGFDSSYNSCTFDCGYSYDGCDGCYSGHDYYDYYYGGCYDCLSYGVSSYHYPSYVTSYSYSTPSYIAKPISVTAPPPVASPPVRPAQTTSTVTNTNITKNVNVNNIDNSNNSINNSFNTNVATVTPVSTLPVQYSVQYVYSQPVYTYTPTYYPQNLSCAITASPSMVAAGQSTYLGWSSTGATSAWIEGIGAVALYGNIAVNPGASRTYTMTVTGPGGTRTCSTYITVGVPYVAAPSVSLSQIPYTGYDFGTVGNVVYWSGLVLFALAAGYLLVYHRGGIGTVFLSFARYGKGSATTVAPVAPSQEPLKSPELPATLPPAKQRDEMVFQHSVNGSQPRIVINRW